MPIDLKTRIVKRMKSCKFETTRALKSHFEVEPIDFQRISLGVSMISHKFARRFPKMWNSETENKLEKHRGLVVFFLSL